MSIMTKHQNLFRSSAVMAQRARRRLAGNLTNEVISGMMSFGLVSYFSHATSLCIVLNAPAGVLFVCVLGRIQISEISEGVRRYDMIGMGI